jgi:uncharacterized membrane protein YqaE (UPF0057 family)
MKTNNIITAGFALLLGVIFTSCSTSIDIAKRQFSNGYYVHVNSSKHQAETVAVSKKAEPMVAEDNTSMATATAQENNSIPAKEAIVSNVSSFSASVENKQPVSVRKKRGDAVASADVTSVANNTLESKKQMRSQKRADRIANHLMRGDAPGIVLILLCIFLPPVAVGIVNDWGSKFWIDILLTLLFYFPGMIYAFIVCFS